MTPKYKRLLRETLEVYRQQKTNESHIVFYQIDNDLILNLVKEYMNADDQLDTPYDILYQIGNAQLEYVFKLSLIDIDCNEIYAGHFDELTRFDLYQKCAEAAITLYPNYASLNKSDLKRLALLIKQRGWFSSKVTKQDYIDSINEFVENKKDLLRDSKINSIFE